MGVSTEKEVITAAAETSIDEEITARTRIGQREGGLAKDELNRVVVWRSRPLSDRPKGIIVYVRTERPGYAVQDMRSTSLLLFAKCFSQFIDWERFGDGVNVKTTFYLRGGSLSTLTSGKKQARHTDLDESRDALLNKPKIPPDTQNCWKNVLSQTTQGSNTQMEMGDNEANPGEAIEEWSKRHGLSPSYETAAVDARGGNAKFSVTLRLGESMANGMGGNKKEAKFYADLAMWKGLQSKE